MLKRSTVIIKNFCFSNFQLQFSFLVSYNMTQIHPAQWEPLQPVLILIMSLVQGIQARPNISNHQPRLGTWLATTNFTLCLSESCTEPSEITSDKNIIPDFYTGGWWNSEYLPAVSLCSINSPCGFQFVQKVL